MVNNEPNLADVVKEQPLTASSSGGIAKSRKGLEVRDILNGIYEVRDQVTISRSYRSLAQHKTE